MYECECIECVYVCTECVYVCMSVCVVSSYCQADTCMSVCVVSSYCQADTREINTLTRT